MGKSDQPNIDYRRYLDPRTLAKIAALDIRARLIVEGFVTGMHRSPYRGFSVEFAQHRPYASGDDIKYIDWKVFGRTDRHYIKQYEEETNLQVLLVVDASSSMNYAGQVNTDWRKFDHATSIAASMAYVALRQQDGAGLAIFDSRLRHLIRPSNNPRQWRIIIEELSTTPGAPKTDTGHVLEEIAGEIRHRSLVVLISDLFDDPERIIKGIRRLRHRRHDLIVLQTLDHDEIEFPFRATTMFRGMEEANDVLVEPQALRDAYLNELHRHTAQIRTACHQLHVDYAQVDTSVPLDISLPGFLATRAARMA